MSNDFVPFSNNPTNVMALADYDPLAPAGNQTGIASSSFNNRALRQGTTIAAVVAQLMANITDTNVQDIYDTSDVTIPQPLIAQAIASFGMFPPISQSLSSSGTLGMVSIFFIKTPTTGPSPGDTYTNNGCTFTVLSTAAWPWVVMQATSSYAQPSNSGTLTRASGAGDATLTFYAVRNPSYLDVYCQGGGGGSGGALAESASSGGASGGYVYARLTPLYAGYPYVVGAGGAGGGAGSSSGSSGDDTTFGASLITAGGGGFGSTGENGTTPTAVAGGTGGTASGGDVNIPGTSGQPGFGFNAIWVSGAGGGSGGPSLTSYTTGFGGVGGTNGGGASGGASGSGGANQAGGIGGGGFILVRFAFQ